MVFFKSSFYRAQQINGWIVFVRRTYPGLAKEPCVKIRFKNAELSNGTLSNKIPSTAYVGGNNHKQ